MRVVVADTGPLLHLLEADALDLLGAVGSVHAPPAVEDELRRLVADWALQRPDWLIAASLEEPYSTESRNWTAARLLDRGEAEAVALARQLVADWLLTDDAAARLFAQDLGVEAHGSLGVVLWLSGAGRLGVAEAEALLDRLAASSLWVSDRVLREAREALRRIAP